MLFVLMAFALGVGLLLLLAWKTRQRTIAFDADSPRKAAELLPLIGAARNRIQIASDFHDGFYRTDSTRLALDRASRRGVVVRLLVEQERDYCVDAQGPEPWYRRWLRNKDARIRRTDALENHFLIVDDTVRLESEHRGRDFGSVGEDVAMFYHGFTELSERQARLFDSLWEREPD